MSRGKPRHQASRRRTYSARQRDVRERRDRDHRGHASSGPTDTMTAFEIEESLDFESPTSWGIRLPGRTGGLIEAWPSAERARQAGSASSAVRGRVRARLRSPVVGRAPGAGRSESAGYPACSSAIAAAAGLALFYLSQSSHVAAIGYEIDDLRAQLAELRAEQQQLIFQIGEARSPAVIERRAKSTLHLVSLPPNAVTFAQPSTNRHK